MDIIFRILTHSTTQFALFYGSFFVGGCILTYLSRWTANAYRQFLFPQFGTYAFGAIGVPIHEFSHAFFCKLFAHEVQKVKWFDAAAKGGAHGAVTHLYNPWNPYQRLGHLFIGLGPVILGPLFLAVLYYFLVPGGQLVFSAPVGSFDAALNVTALFFKSLVTPAAVRSPSLYIFLYLATCISSQMELSREDLGQAFRGIPWNAGLLIFLNAFAWLFQISVHPTFMVYGWSALTWSAALFLFAGLLASLNLLICTAGFGFINRICGYNAINPFRT